MDCYYFLLFYDDPSCFRYALCFFSSWDSYIYFEMYFHRASDVYLEDFLTWVQLFIQEIPSIYFLLVVHGQVSKSIDSGGNPDLPLSINTFKLLLGPQEIFSGQRWFSLFLIYSFLLLFLFIYYFKYGHMHVCKSDNYQIESPFESPEGGALKQGLLNLLVGPGAKRSWVNRVHLGRLAQEVF